MTTAQRPVVALRDPNQERRDRETFNDILSHRFDDWRHQTNVEKLAGITPTNTAYPPGDIRRYGAKGDGVTNDQPAIQRAIDQANAGGIAWYVPEGTFLIQSALSVPDSSSGINGNGEGIGSVIKKGFNGDMLTLGIRGQLKNLFFDGNGDNFTGRGIVISTGTNPDGYQYCQNVRTWETESYCLEFVGDGVGFGSQFHGCFFKLANNDTYCVKMPVDDVNVGIRMFIGCEAPFDSLMDINGSENTQIVGGMSGRSVAGGLWCLGFADGAAQALVCGMRLAGGGATGHIKGTIHQITGCTIAGDIEIDSGATSNKIVANNLSANIITDNSGSVGTSANEFDTNVTSFVTTWGAAGTAPAIGNGSINGSYTRKGRLVTFSARIIFGSTTTFGTGIWSFTLPFQSHTRLYEGAARALDNGSEFLIGLVEIPEGGSTTCRLLLKAHGAAVTNFAGATVPITWASGDEIWFTVTYDV